MDGEVKFRALFGPVARTQLVVLQPNWTQKLGDSEECLRKNLSISSLTKILRHEGKISKKEQENQSFRFKENLS